MSVSYDARRPLQGQKALVTGGSPGIGAAGTAVGVNYRSNPEGTECVAEEIRRSG